MKHLASITIKNLAIGLTLLTSLNTIGWSQGDAYPNRPIKLIITWPVGGFADTLGRTVANQLTTSLGQQVVVENRGGANGMIGACNQPNHVWQDPLFDRKRHYSARCSCLNTNAVSCKPKLCTKEY